MQVGSPGLKGASPAISGEPNTTKSKHVGEALIYPQGDAGVSRWNSRTDSAKTSHHSKSEASLPTKRHREARPGETPSTLLGA